MEVVYEHSGIKCLAIEFSIPALFWIGGFKYLVSPSVVNSEVERINAIAKDTFKIVLPINIR